MGAPTIVSSGGSNASGVTSKTQAVTVTGSNRYLEASAIGTAGADVITGATFPKGGSASAMTLIDKHAIGGGRWMYLFGMVAPDVGTANITVSASASGYIEINYILYNDADQALNPVTTNKDKNGSATSSVASSTLTTANDNSRISLHVLGQGGSITAGAGTTLGNTSLVGAALYSTAAFTPAGSPHTVSANITTNVMGYIAIEVAGASTPANSITLTSPVSKQSYQVNGSNQVTVNIIGTTSGITSDLEMSVDGGAYTTIATGVNGAFNIPRTLGAGQGSVVVRMVSDTATSATATQVTRGDVFAVGGDSIAVGQGTTLQTATGSFTPTLFDESDSWKTLADPTDTAGQGSFWPLLATQIMAKTGRPVAFITAATGSTDVAGSHNEWAPGNSGYTQLLAQITQSGVNAVKAVLMHLGPNAVVNATTLSQATYNAALDTLANAFATNIPGAPKTHFALFGEVNTGAPPDRRAAIDNLRKAILEAYGDNANVKPGPWLGDQDYADNVHPQTTQHITDGSKRWYCPIGEAYFGEAAGFGRGPRFVSAMYNLARNQITVIFDRNLKTLLTHSPAAWLVVDQTPTIAVSSIAYHGTNPAALVLTLAAAASNAAGTSRISFASGNDSIGLVVPMSADVTMPSGTAIQLPAEPFISAVVDEFDTVAPTQSGFTMSGGLLSASGSITLSETATLWTKVDTSPSATDPGAGAEAGAGWTSQAGTSGSNVVSYPTLTAGTKYGHAISVDPSGNRSTVAHTAQFTVSAPDTTPPTFNGSLTVGTVTSTSIQVSWSAGSDDTAVTAYETSPDGTTWTDRGNVLTHNFTGLTPSTSYTLRVRAKDAAGNVSTPPIQVTQSTSAAPDTTPPTLSGSLTVGTVTSSAIQVSWSAGSDNVAVASYERSTDGTTWANVGNVLTTTFSGLTPSTSYTLRVRAKDAAGNVSTPPIQVTQSTAASSGVDTLPPSQITVLSTTAAGRLVMTWAATTDDTAVDHYEVRIDNGNWIDVGLVLTYAFDNVVLGLPHTLHVKALDAAGNESLVTSISIPTYAGTFRTYPLAGQV